MTLPRGTKLGSYEILAPLGAGGMGEVWLAEDTRLKRKVALKLLPAELTSDADRVRRFEQEAQAASALNHPNIITVYDIGECEAGRFIVMELVAGRTLRAVISEDNSLETTLSLGQQIAKALSAAHAAGITHRDIKPDNIMVRDDGYAKVLDFGLARLLLTSASGEEAATLAQQTTPGTVMGTLAYMSPEQASGQSVGHASDIFALGIVLYELATGRHPFKAETLVGYLHAITLQEPPPLTKWKPELPASLNDVILRMLSKEASLRPTASEVTQRLQDIERRGDAPESSSSDGATMIKPAPQVSTPRDEGFWVAVLPFKWRGANAELDALAEGLSEDIVTGLSRFSYLRVIARGSTLQYATDSGDVRAIGKALGARYVMEGSLRQAGAMLRVAVQLVDAGTGAHLWTETYNRTFSPEAVFEIQDELVPRIVSTVADWYGALPHSMSESVRLKPPDQLSSYEAVLRSFGYFERIAPEEHAAVRTGLERAVEQSPGNADGWAMLSMIYGEEHRFGFNVQPDPLGRSLQAARRAVDAGHANHFAWLALAQALFFRKEFAAFREAAARALALNPMDGSTIEYLAHLLAFAGDWERGCELGERARQLNPNHPGWYWAIHALDAYRKYDYQTARSYTHKSFLRGGAADLYTQGLLAAIYGQLGEREVAEKTLQAVRAQQPDFPLTVRDTYEKWYLPELVEQLMEGLRKAGLELADEVGGATYSPAPETKARPESSPSIAVLPFGNLSPDPDNEFFADGLTEEVIADLSVIRALRVISRSSAMRFKGTNKDLRAIARELDVRYLLEGSVRRAGTSLRITAQLIDAENDSHLWAEKYSGDLEDVFTIQEEISRKIVNALKLRLTEAEARGIAERPIENAAAYDCYLRARYEVFRFTAEGLDRAQQVADAGLTLIGENPLLLATRGMVSWYYVNFSIRPNESYLEEAAAYAARALAQDALCHAAIFLRGLVASKRGDIESAIRDLRLACEQKPGDAVIVNELIRHLFSAGQEHSESAASVYEEALRLDPLHPLNWAQTSWRHFSAGELAEAAECARRIFDLAERGNPARVYAAYYLAIANEREEALSVFEAEGRALSGTAYGSVSLFLNCALQQDAAGAIAHVTPQLEQAATWVEFLALFLADGYALIGHHDAALRWLRKAVGLGFINYPYLAMHDPFLANVRSDPQFSELMREVKARWEALSQNRPRPMPAAEVHTQILPPGTPVQNQEVEGSGKPPANPNLNSIAVLPFANISADEENEYFCDGLAEELLNALAKIDELKVAARTSAFSFKGKNAEAREIGRALNVNTVLEGSVRKAGHRLRINVQLVNAADGYHLWSERYDREMNDIFDVQDEITLTVVDALKVRLLGKERAEVLKHYTDNTEAYELYLKGRYHASRFTREGFDKAIEYLNQAIEKDPRYALAHAGIAHAYYHAATIHMPPSEAFPKVKEASMRALELDDALAEAHTMLALFTANYDRQRLQAEAGFRRAVALAPNNVLPHQCYGIYLAMAGRFDEAIAELQRAQKSDPLSLVVSFLLGWTFYFARQPEKVIEESHRSLEIEDDFWMTHLTMALGYEQTGQYDEAVVSLEKAKRIDDSPWIPAVLARVYARLGRRDAARTILDELTEKSKREWVAPYLVATAYVSLDQWDQAFEWLEKAISEYDEWMQCCKVDPALDPLRSDARYQDLLQRMGFSDG